MGRFGPGSFRPWVVSASLYQNVDCFGQADNQIDRETENDKKIGGGGQVRVDVNEEFTFLYFKKSSGGCWVGGGFSVNVKEDLKFLLKCKISSGGGGPGLWEGRVWGDVRMDKCVCGRGGRAGDGGGGGVSVDVDEEVKFL